MTSRWGGAWRQAAAHRRWFPPQDLVAEGMKRGPGRQFDGETPGSETRDLAAHRGPPAVDRTPGACPAPAPMVDWRPSDAM